MVAFLFIGKRAKKGIVCIENASRDSVKFTVPQQNGRKNLEGTVFQCCPEVIDGASRSVRAMKQLVAFVIAHVQVIRKASQQTRYIDQLARYSQLDVTDRGALLR